ncbi:hypothetical protein S40288_08752 [Stachybotrys chartarum IBT 40288]|nr:hypothetical protein S40288_08752 [Stachybotrys chartarum IBT 40288]
MIWKSYLVSLLGLGAVPLVHSQTPYPITGVTVDPRSGGVPLRQNINQLQSQGGPKWDLYISALRAMFDRNASDQLSYFQISGIHGRPYVEWNGGGSKISNGWQGYCPHGENLFLPWHRTYVLLFEQVLVDHARRIAQQYPRRYRNEYLQAAESLRAPYWDWAADNDVPPATVPRTIRINVPDGDRLRQVDVDNPLASFQFPRDALSGNYGSFEAQGRNITTRCAAPGSYPNDANRNMDRRPYRQWTYDALTLSRDFSEFSSTGESGISLEQIHNGVHWDAGCGGLFLDADYSAFDPLFMLHHTNVDRLWAYWQTIHPEHSMFRRTYKGRARYSTPGGSNITPRSPLQPFYQRPGVFHSTESIASLRNLGYVYEGLEHWAKSQEQMAQDSKRLINRLYAPSNQAHKRLMAREEVMTRYFATIAVNVTEFERPCSVEVYLDGARVGGLVVMMQPETGTIYGNLGLDDVVEAQGMRNLTVEQTIKKIQASLEVEIVKRDGSLVPLDSVSGLDVGLEDVPVTPPAADDELPRYGAARQRSAGAHARSHGRNCRCRKGKTY